MPASDAFRRGVLSRHSVSYYALSPLRYSDSITKAGDNHVKSGNVIHQDEVLHGQIVDTNAAWLADFFFHQGLPLSRRNTVGDNLDDLVTILRERSQHADVLIVNGGLGPTSDDLSALAAATAKGEGLVLHEAWLKEMERYFHERGRVMAPSNRKQAELPASAEFINNPVGTACGFAIQLNRCLMFFTLAYRQNLR